MELRTWKIMLDLSKNFEFYKMEGLSLNILFGFRPLLSFEGGLVKVIAFGGGD